MVPFELIQLSAGIGGALLAYHMGNEESNTKYYIRNIRRKNIKESIIPLFSYYCAGFFSSGLITLIAEIGYPDETAINFLPVLAAGLVSVASAVIGGLYLSRNDNKTKPKQ